MQINSLYITSLILSHKYDDDGDDDFDDDNGDKRVVHGMDFTVGEINSADAWGYGFIDDIDDEADQAANMMTFTDYNRGVFFGDRVPGSNRFVEVLIKPRMFAALDHLFPEIAHQWRENSKF